MNRLSLTQFYIKYRDRLSLTLFTDETFLKNKYINNPHIQKSNLALAGFTKFVHTHRIQVLGETEIGYIDTLKNPDELLEKIAKINIACFVITKALKPPAALLRISNKHAIPIIGTTKSSSVFIANVTNILEDMLSARSIIHGVMVDVLEVGILIVGKSGIGKSELALDLVSKGHRLVADDTVEVMKRGPSILGSSRKLVKNFLEVRGLGILNIRDLFGMVSVSDSKEIDMVLSLEEWSATGDLMRAGLNEEFYEIMDVKIPMFRIPVSPGRNLATIAEVSARNYILNKSPYASKSLEKIISDRLKRKGRRSNRA